MKDTIKQLVEAYGPAGREEQVAEYLTEVMQTLVDKVYTDELGNVIAVKQGPAAARKVMLAAHMDEIGVIITDIDDNGFLRFSNIGGVSPFTLIGQRVRFANGTIGVFGREKLDDIKDLKLNKMYIDIGVTSREEAEGKVGIGDSAVYHREFTLQGQRVVAKSLDNRISCAILIEVARRLENSPHEVYLVFTAQEEVGLRGARTAAYALDPDYGITLLEFKIKTFWRKRK